MSKENNNSSNYYEDDLFTKQYAYEKSPLITNKFQVNGITFHTEQVEKGDISEKCDSEQLDELQDDMKLEELKRANTIEIKEKMGYIITSSTNISFLEHGAQGKVEKYYNENNSDIFAVKTYNTTPKNGKIGKLFRLIEGINSKQLNRPIAQSNDKIAQELCEHGDLMDYIKNGNITNNYEMQKVFHQIVDGVSDMHNAGRQHLDLKLENILINGERNVQICDLDKSTKTRHLKPDKYILQGTQGYHPPEVIYMKPPIIDSIKWDVQCIGSILFNIRKNANIDLAESERSLISKMKQYDPKVRIDIETIKKHPYQKDFHEINNF